MISLADGLTALTIGLTGSTHCIAMCGGIAGALSLGIENQRSRRSELFLLLNFHLGRLTSYAFIGAALGGLLGLASGVTDALTTLLRLVAGLLLIAMGLYIANWWSGLARLEAIGTPVWSHLQPLVKKILPIQSPLSALLLGGLWGWLPCGLVYSALTWAITAEQASDAAFRMLLFGLGTLPAMLSLSVAADATRRLLQRAGTRRLAGVLLIFYGCWTLITPLQHLLQAPETAPHHHH